uniref:O-glucosyltransferase rumi-like isoform X2 n=1 Tax=Rhizophora mucronata TaxID=61149 RepID=A0A2P2ILC6_RHIMU
MALSPRGSIESSLDKLVLMMGHDLWCPTFLGSLLDRFEFDFRCYSSMGTQFFQAKFDAFEGPCFFPLLGPQDLLN